MRMVREGVLEMMRYQETYSKKDQLRNLGYIVLSAHSPHALFSLPYLKVHGRF